jgi:signal recognition particle subunit SRP54
MAFESLSEKLNGVFKKLRGKGVLSENDINEAMREVKLALLEADVNYKVVKDFVADVKEKALGEEVLKSLTPGQQVIKIVNDELTDLMGGSGSKLTYAPSGFTTILMVGLQGTGKTTTCGKLAIWLKKQGKMPMMAACDIYRPAAIDQLEIVGKSAGVPVFSDRDCKDPSDIATRARKEAERKGLNVLIVDTAGRLHIDEELMDELKTLKKNVKPHEILLVVDAMTGQDAVTAAESFHEALGIDGIIMTKLDGDTRGGAALSIKAVVNKPIKFISSGEKLDTLDVFHPERIADRILGMGDVVTLVEKAQEQINEEEARKLKKKLIKSQFDFNDFYQQIQQIKKMGNIKDLASMLPGVGRALKDVDIDNSSFKNVEAIIQSMTPFEKEHPEVLNGSRRNRIASGSGTSIAEVNRLIKQFEQTKKVMKNVAGGGLRNRMAQMRNLRNMGR